MPRHNIAKRCKFFIWDSFSVLPFLLMLVHMSWATLALVTITSIVLFVLDRRGMTLPMLFRYLRGAVSGPSKNIRPSWRKHY